MTLCCCPRNRMPALVMTLPRHAFTSPEGVLGATRLVLVFCCRCATRRGTTTTMTTTWFFFLCSFVPFLPPLFHLLLPFLSRWPFHVHVPWCFLLLASSVFSVPFSSCPLILFIPLLLSQLCACDVVSNVLLLVPRVSSFLVSFSLFVVHQMLTERKWVQVFARPPTGSLQQCKPAVAASCH